MLHPPGASTHSPLLVQDRRGESSCFNCVIEHHQTRAFNLASRMLGDWALAEDAVQDAFLSGYRSFHQFRGDNLAAWLMRIVANRCRDMLRSRRRNPTVRVDPNPGDPDEAGTAPSALDLPSTLESPEDHVERSELNRAIQTALNTLSQDQRLALLLVDVQGFSYEDAGLSMNCSLGTVKSRVSRGRKALANRLRNLGELLPAQFRQET